MASRFTDVDLPAKAGSYLRRGLIAPTSRRSIAPALGSVAPAFRWEILLAGMTLLLAGALFAQAPADRQAPASADASARQAVEAQAKRAANRLAALQREADSLATQSRTLLAELRKLEIDRAIKVEQLEQIERDAADVQSKLLTATERTEALKGEAERQRPDVEARLVQLYKMGRAGYWRLLLDVNNLRDVGRAYRTAAALGRIDRDRVNEHRQTMAELTKERRTLQARAKELDALQRKAQQASAAVERAVTARANLVTTIDSRRDLNAQLTGELQDAQRKLQATLAQVAAGRPAAATSLPLRPFQGTLPWPAEGVLSARFGRRTPGTAGPPVRNGIELSLAEGHAVHAVHEGTVAFADLFSGYGTLVIVEHADKAYSLYGHLGTASVHKGDRVETGGTVGLAGRNPSGNPSLYFELRVDGKAVDPLQWLKR
jgi:septal ring factor EnvC (AmiA/AmiB activator)